MFWVVNNYNLLFIRKLNYNNFENIINADMPVHFINMTEQQFLSSKLIYKYMPIEKGLQMMENHRFWFANPATWSDPFEKRFLEAEYFHRANSKCKFTWKDRVFCACFTSLASSEAPWKVYSSNSFGIEFAIDREHLFDELKKYSIRNPHFHIFIGDVEYMKTKDIEKTDINKIPFKPALMDSYTTMSTKARLLMLKRFAFRYEVETRIIIIKPKSTKELGIFFDYTCSNNQLFRSVTLDPEMGNSTTKVLKEVLIGDQYMNCDVTSKKVLKSRIYDTAHKSSKIIKF